MHLPCSGSQCILSHSFRLLQLLIFILEHEARLTACTSFFNCIIISIHKAVLQGYPPRELALCCHFKLCLGAGFCKCCFQLVLFVGIYGYVVYVPHPHSCLDTVKEPPTVFL